MVDENLSERYPRPTIPLDANDPWRFSQLVETVKDVFQKELTDFLDYQKSSFVYLKAEIPTIEKYNVGAGANDQAIETFARVLLQHPDVLERLPLIAITTAGGMNKKLSLGGQYVDAIQPCARLKGTLPGPFAFVTGDRIAFQTTPFGGAAITSTVLFVSSLFSSLGAATLDEVIACINVQALYVTACKTLYSTPVPVLRIDAYGAACRQTYPNSVTVLGPPYSTANALAVLGLTAGATDSAALHNPINRRQLAEDMTVGIDIGTESENERRELTDLINYFFTMEMDKRKFCFYGRTFFDDEFPDENFQIILKDAHNWAGEAEIPRQGSSGEQLNLIYINRLNVPITIIDYVDRIITTYPRRGADLQLYGARVDADGLPAGDHTGSGETSG